MEKIEIKQRTYEWFSARCGKLTASQIYTALSKSQASRDLEINLAAQRITGEIPENFVSKEMQRGVDLEPVALENYALLTDFEVKEVGFVPHPKIEMSGASPDGLVGEDGLVEIKCPRSANHLRFFLDDKIKKEYIFQVQWQMACTGRKWCDFVSFDDRTGANLSIKIKRLERDDVLIAELEKGALEFLEKVKKIEDQLNSVGV